MTWHMHVCALSPQCRRDMKGIVPPHWRLYLNTPWVFITLALRPRDTMGKFVGWDRETKTYDHVKTQWVTFNKPADRVRKV